jgi:hypothetical protein
VLRVEEGTVRAGADLVDDVWLEIGVDGAWNVLALTCGVLAAPWQNSWGVEIYVPVSEKKVLKPWSSSLALRSSVR